MGEDSLVQLDLGHDGDLPPLFHKLAEGLGELGLSHSVVEAGLCDGWFLLIVGVADEGVSL